MVFNIVAGHSPKAQGAIGHLNEVTEDRKVKNALVSILKAEGHTVYDCTSDNGDSNKCLAEQVTKCNAHKGIDVHIHFNAGSSDPNSRTTGTEVWVYSNKSQALDEAQRVVNNIASCGFTNRGVKYSTGLYVLRKSVNPAMLIEVCFVDDRDDSNLYRVLGAEMIAKEIAKGLLDKRTLNSDKKQTTTTPAKQTASTGYKVKITASALNVRSGAGTNYPIRLTIKKNEVYTIVEEKNGWGKLKSGAGWISLQYTKKV